MPTHTRAIGTLPSSVVERLEKNSIPIPFCGCQIWLLGCDTSGYGSISVDGSMYQAHRLSFAAHVGPIPKGMHVLHSCDIKSCIQPMHLSLGTHAENMADMAAKGRASRMKGIKHPMSKLTEMQVISIRQEVGTSSQIAARYGVHFSLIQLIKKRKLWRHI